MLSKQAQVNRVREFFGDTAANIVKAIIDEKICRKGDNITVLIELGVSVKKDYLTSPGGLIQKIEVKNGIAIGTFIDGKEPEYHFVRPEEK